MSMFLYSVLCLAKLKYPICFPFLSKSKVQSSTSEFECSTWIHTLHTNKNNKTADSNWGIVRTSVDVSCNSTSYRLGMEVNHWIQRTPQHDHLSEAPTIKSSHSGWGNDDAWEGCLKATSQLKHNSTYWCIVICVYAVHLVSSYPVDDKQVLVHCAAFTCDSFLASNHKKMWMLPLKNSQFL